MGKGMVFDEIDKTAIAPLFLGFQGLLGGFEVFCSVCFCFNYCGVIFGFSKIRTGPAFTEI